MSRKSEAILDELFSSIKPKKAAQVSEDEETEEEEESSEEDSSTDESERE